MYLLSPALFSVSAREVSGLYGVYLKSSPRSEMPLQIQHKSMFSVDGLAGREQKRCCFFNYMVCL